MFRIMKESPIEMLHVIAQIIYDKKGSNIMALDVQGLSSITDYLLIAEGDADRHVSAIARSIIEQLQEMGGPQLLHTEGLRSGDWVVLDYGGIMIHLFMRGLRERYCLERLWEESKLIDLNIDSSKPATG